MQFQHGYTAVKKNPELTDAGADKCCTISICDRDWYLAEHPQTVVLRTRDPVTVRDIGDALHASSEYVPASIFPEGESNGSMAMIRICRDIHLVKTWARRC